MLILKDSGGKGIPEMTATAGVVSLGCMSFKGAGSSKNTEEMFLKLQDIPLLEFEMMWMSEDVDA